MSKKNTTFDLQHLIQSHFEEVEQIKKNNQQSEDAFQTHVNEIREKMRDFDNLFNDI